MGMFYFNVSSNMRLCVLQQGAKKKEKKKKRKEPMFSLNYQRNAESFLLVNMRLYQSQIAS